MRHFTKVEDIGDVKAAVKEALEVKKDRFAYSELGKNRTLMMIFFNSSLRTRLSTQKAGMNLGMNTIVLDVNQGAWRLETERGVIMDGDCPEHLLEAVPVMGCYCDIIGVRSFANFESKEDDYNEKILNQFINYSGRPVFSMEAATRHPLQSFADLITIEEYKRKERPKVVMTWAPHPRSLPQAVPNSFAEWMLAADYEFVITHPEGYELDTQFTDGAVIEYDRKKAFAGADFVYAKNWAAYTDPNYGKILTADRSWTVDTDIMRLTDNAYFMHCLPVRRNMIVTDDVIESPQSIVIPEAANREISAQTVLKRILEGLKKSSLSIFLLILSTLFAGAQTNVEKVMPGKAAGEGIIYYLPKTSLIINAEVTKTTVKAGVYYKYAERYLGVKNVAAEDKISYELGKIALINKGIRDEDNKYKIEFRQKTVAPFVYLTVDGLLCAINDEYVPEPAVEDTLPKQPSNKQQNLSSSSVYTEELLVAGSVAKQAEVAAKQIYHLRESRTDILTGDADNLPPDGEAMKLVISKLEEQERELTKLFTGTETRETNYFDVTIIPSDEVEDEILFRFSTRLGILDEDDLGGDPVYISVKALERAPELEPKEAEKKTKQMAKGVIYNVPGKARVEITFNKKKLLKKDTPFVQFGTQEVLTPEILEDKKQPVKVVFYPETGGIKKSNK